MQACGPRSSHTAAPASTTPSTRWGPTSRRSASGAEALECDVRLTADGHLVCVHDRDLRRTATRRGLVSTMELADLDQLEFASWKNPWAELDDEAPDRDPGSTRCSPCGGCWRPSPRPTDRVELAIETKHPTRYGGLVERRLVEAARGVRLDRRRQPGPGDELLLRRPAADAAAGARPAAGDADREGPALAGAQAGARGRLDPGPGHRRAAPSTRSSPRSWSRSGRDIHVWTVNTREQLDLCARSGSAR